MPDTPPGVPGAINTNTGQVLSGPLAGQTLPTPNVSSTISSSSMTSPGSFQFPSSSSNSSSPSIADILAQYTTPSADVTAAQGAQSDTLSKLQALIGASGNQTAEQNRLMSAAGIPGQQSQLNDINNTIRSLTAQAGEFKLQQEGRLAPQFQINGAQAQADRVLSQKLLGLSATANYLTNNIALANDQVSRALKAEFDPINAQIDYYKQLLAVNGNNLSAAQKKQADQLSASLDLYKQQVTNDQATRAQMYDIIKTNGSTIPASVISSALSADPTTGLAMLSQYSSPSGRFKDVTLTDSMGNQYTRVFDTQTGQFVGGGTGGGGFSGGGGAGAGGGSSTGGGAGSGLDFNQYGLLSKTDFNPNSTVDQLAQKYLSLYLNGTQPTASSLGRSIKPGALAQIDARARDLYFKATGQSLPSDTKITQGYQEQLIGNNKLLNNLAVQEGTIKANADLLINNINAGNVNQAAPIVNGVIDNIKNALGDPNVAAYLAQNATVGNELGALLALKNAQGTTVHDKLEAAGLISKSATAGQIASVVKNLMQEALNARSAIQSASANLYQNVDPLQLDQNNPARTLTINSGQVDQLLSAKGINYNDLIAQMQAAQSQHPGTQPAIDLQGNPVFATPEEISSGKYIPL